MDIKLVAAVACEELNVRRWCRVHGISPSTFYKWRARFRDGGVEVLNELSRRPGRSPSAIVSLIEDAIVVARKELIDQGWDGGADSIMSRLILERVDPLPSRATIWRVLSRRGMITAQPSKRPKRPGGGSSGHDLTTAGRSMPPTGNLPTTRWWRSSTSSMTTRGC